MNKKIFTLLVGALLSIGSSFTASAQAPTPTPTLTVHHKDTSSVYAVSFADTLRADTAKKLVEGAYYLLSITDIANPTTEIRNDSAFAPLMRKEIPSKDLSYVMFVDSLGQLRMDTLTVLDNGGYGYGYKGSSKIEAIRRASWCVDADAGGVKGSNVIFDFNNMATGEMLEAPLPTMNPALWYADPDGQGRRIYTGIDGDTTGINLIEDDDLIVSGWHFSQTYDPTQNLQTGMPLYSYVERDSVLVMVIDEKSLPYEVPDGTDGVGGWKVTVKYVAVNDLIKDEVGNIRLVADGGKYVSNVLLFTLKKLDKFVLNANDYNAINTTISFNPNALNEVATNDGWNPFTDGEINPHGRGPLYAFEVTDSLYRYGYMQFRQAALNGGENTAGKWLFVDTGFWNVGNDEFLRFAWSDLRRDTTYRTGDVKWGGTKPDTIDYSGSADPKYKSDSLDYRLRFQKDSIMENQSKFRVVYDPFTDSTYINVYQTRVAYTNYADPQNPVTPVWWTNSFVLEPTASGYYTPSDSMKAVAAGGGNLGDYWLGFGASNDSLRASFTNGDSVVHGFHSFFEWYPESAPKGMDKVMISTADTSVFYYDGQPLSHIYGWNARGNAQGYLYRDSLFYVDIQNLEAGQYRIATINQAMKEGKNQINTHIKLGFGGCEGEREGIATIGDNLYLIRNASGEYLCVPIYSVTDSVYWVTPKEGEDPTQMPSYQWVVENKRSGMGAIGSPFKLTNREFENVSFDYVYVYASGDKKMKIGDPKYAGAKFANDRWAIIRAGVIEGDSLEKGEFSKARGFSTDTYSFLPLAADVKGDQLLGYKYVDKDETYVDVYAFKYLHFLAPGADANYMGWNGYDNPNDTTVYVRYNSYHDKLYFMLQEMPYENIGDYSLSIGYDENGNPIENNAGYAAVNDYTSIYEIHGKNKQNNYVNRDSIVMENFGYMPTKYDAATGKTVYNYKLIPGLKPLARQAYRLLLKDYYKFAPTIRGDYMTVGEQDRYILSDRTYATRPYRPETGRVEGVFGIPYFYFRNTYFGVPGVDNVPEDYFALVQRLDTISIVDGHSSTIFKDVAEYVESRWGKEAADRITEQVRKSRELGAFIAKVGEEETDLRIAVRGESELNVATFTLERDDDPLYRRFHWNDYFEKTNDDTPLVLEFHRLNNENVKLFENSGADKGRSGGGYEYNLDNNGNLLKDSLGNVISFLGVKNISSFPSITEDDDPHASTNYAIYVDTAYINRGTGWIKPQYMLAVDVEVVDPCEICEDNTKQDFRGYTIGRYLYNTSMYAKELARGEGPVNYDLVQKVDPERIRPAIAGAPNNVTGNVYTRSYTSTKWERLAFTWAIHRGDSLYILKNVAPYQGAAYDTQLLIDRLGSEYGGTNTKGNIDFDELIKVKGKSIKDLKGKTIGLHAIINLADNEHKDWVFSFRYIQRRADDFIIESETTERDRINGPIIRPGYGGWVKYDNEVPIITRSEMHNNELLAEGDIMNVTRSNIDPVSNDPVTEASAVKVLGGNGAITIQNASGKTVVVSNVLGQTIANTKLTSDNASIAVPAGVVVVVIEGEDAAKVLVK